MYQRKSIRLTFLYPSLVSRALRVKGRPTVFCSTLLWLSSGEFCRLLSTGQHHPKKSPLLSSKIPLYIPAIIILVCFLTAAKASSPLNQRFSIGIDCRVPNLNSIGLYRTLRIPRIEKVNLRAGNTTRRLITFRIEPIVTDWKTTHYHWANDADAFF